MTTPTPDITEAEVAKLEEVLAYIEKATTSDEMYAYEDEAKRRLWKHRHALLAAGRRVAAVADSLSELELGAASDREVAPLNTPEFGRCDGVDEAVKAIRQALSAQALPGAGGEADLLELVARWVDAFSPDRTSKELPEGVVAGIRRIAAKLRAWPMVDPEKVAAVARWRDSQQPTCSGSTLRLAIDETLKQLGLTAKGVRGG